MKFAQIRQINMPFAKRNFSKKLLISFAQKSGAKMLVKSDKVGTSRGKF